MCTLPADSQNYDINNQLEDFESFAGQSLQVLNNNKLTPIRPLEEEI
jgi:hypothetical protein